MDSIGTVLGSSNVKIMRANNTGNVETVFKIFYIVYVSKLKTSMSWHSISKTLQGARGNCTDNIRIVRSNMGVLLS